MPVSQSDYIMRMIEQLGAAMRRLRELLARGAPAAPDVMREAQDAQRELFGPLWPVLERVNAETAVSLIPDERQILLWVELMQLEASAVRLIGDGPRADDLESRAERIMVTLPGREAAGADQ
ncbi:MAG: hypothetical protein H0U67_04800 [Gemmatimonadetes bacterium]|nr:hypothetical protein [Gemmatimonadota bacterium]